MTFNLMPMISSVNNLAPALNLKLLAYLIGSIGIAFEWRSYCSRSGHTFRLWSAGAAVLWGVQYFMLSAWTAGISMLFTAVRTLLSDRTHLGLCKHCTAVGFILLFAMLTTISWQGNISLLPAFSVINTTLALFYLDNRKMRIAMLVSSLAWIANDLYWEAWPSLIAESVAMGINMYTIRKLFAA